MSSRREYLKTVGSFAIGLAVGGIVGYSIPKPAPTPVVKKPITLGSLPDRTGFLANYGYWHDRGVNAAVKYINEVEGGVDGRPVVIVSDDAASDVTIATRKLRKLVTEEGAIAIFPSHSGAIGIAAAPILKDELKVPYFYNGYTYPVLLQKCRYIIQWHGSVRSLAYAFREHIPKMGKKWAIPYIDYAFGWALRDYFKAALKDLGYGEVVSEIAIPVGTTDFYPYISKIPKDVDAIWWSIVGLSEVIGAAKALRELGYTQPALADLGMFQSADLKAMLPLMEGFWLHNVYPQYKSDYETPYLEKLRNLVDRDEFGADKFNPKNYDINAANLAWEEVFACVDAIRATGATSVKDMPEVIKWLEGRTLKESQHYVGGDIYIRAEDHHAFRCSYFWEVKDGKLVFRGKLPPSAMEFKPPEIDYTKIPF